MAAHAEPEKAIPLSLKESPEPDSVFEVRPPGLPTKAVPVFDDQLGVVVGYRHEVIGGVFNLYDLNGQIVGMEEKGLETPWLDPLDLLFVGAGVVRAIGKGIIKGTVRKGPKIAALAARRITARTLAASVAGAMRTSFKGLAVKNLQFTATTAERMAIKGRHVPLHILHLAIKYGKRAADPQGVTGVFRYTTTMIRNGQAYILEVVVRESDWTILHFLYK
jgi:hypothetical protein